MQTVGERKIFSVTEINKYANTLLEQVQVWVEGEIFEVKYKEGQYRYVYFYLKDPKTEYQLPCVIEPSYAFSLGFKLEEGTRVAGYGALGLFNKAGKYRFSVSFMEQFGEGELLRRLQELKDKLQKQGYFADERKRQIPLYPIKVGVITSVVSAAWQDFKKQSIAKYPFLRLVVRDVFVQGSQACSDICQAIKELDAMNLEAIVLTRGGGSLEDLMAFNTEEVARAIFNCKTPVISAVGHESDVTIADLVADLRASTPTNAAELLVRNYLLLFQRMDQLYELLQKKMGSFVRDQFENLDDIKQRLNKTEASFKELPHKLKTMELKLLMCQKNLISDRQQILKNFIKVLDVSGNNLLTGNQRQLKITYEKLNLLSPTNVLNRGYSIVTTKEGKILKSVEQVAIGELLGVQLHQGRIATEVKSKSI